MRHFVVEITYLLPVEIVINETTPEHRAFLQTGYNAGKLLFSGPQVPQGGGDRAGARGEPGGDAAILPG